MLSACHNYVSTYAAVDSSSYFPFLTWTNRQTDATNNAIYTLATTNVLNNFAGLVHPMLFGRALAANQRL